MTLFMEVMEMICTGGSGDDILNGQNGDDNM